MRMRVVLASLVLLLEPALALAQTFPAFTQTDTYSNSGWGVNTTRGWSFTVSSRIVVEQLGFWDSEENGLASAHGVGLWRDDGGGTATLLTSATVPAGTDATLDGTFRWVSTTAVELQPGSTYVVGAYWTQNNPDMALELGENVVFDSRVSLVEGRAINTLGLAYPSLSAAAELGANFKAHPPANQPPVANAGTDQSAFVGQSVMLAGSAIDPDGDEIVAWQWSIESAPAGSNPVIREPDVALTFFGADLSGDYLVALRASDGLAWSAPDSVTIRLAQILPPIAVATADVTEGMVPLTVHFDASQSQTRVGGALSYYWSFEDGSESSVEMAPTHVFGRTGTFSVGLAITDALGQNDYDFVEITVLPPAAVPALPRFGLVLLGVLLSLAGAYAISRRAGPAA